MINVMIKLIIFDWDDVFTLGAIEGYYQCTHEALNAVGVAMPEQEERQRIKDTWSLGHEEQLQEILKDYPDKVEEAIKVYEKHWFGSTFVDCLHIVPGAQQFLNDIAQHYTLAVVTGGHPSVLKDQIFPKFHIPDVFTQIITIYDLDSSAYVKPHPFMTNQIMKMVGVTPQETVLVGDAKSDMQLAQNANIEPIAVLTGHLNRTDAEGLGVKYIIDDVTKLKQVLTTL
jgi:phosphoglycolate phosphatase-like HAD superfamily hydrolase